MQTTFTFKTTPVFFYSIIFIFLSNSLFPQQPSVTKSIAPYVIDDFFLPLTFNKDSLAGFDEATMWNEMRMSGVELWRQKRQMALAKREFIDRKYKLKTFLDNTGANGKLIGGSNSIMQACTNVDFEMGNLSGWTTGQSPNNNSQTMLPWTNSATGQIVTVAPGPDPNGLPIQQVPPGGGNFAARLGPTGASSGGYSYRLSQTFTVTAANSVFIYKYAVVLNKAPHSCTEQPFFNIRFEDCNNNPIPCGAYQVNAIGSACSVGDNTFINQGQWAYKNWTTRAFDLSAYIGQCVNIEFTVGGCVITQGAHGAYAYVDCSCQPMNLMLNNVVIPTGSTSIAVCTPGNNVLCAPAGFVYNWTGPGVTGQTGQCINVPGAGSYSVALSTPGQNCFNPGLSCNFVVSTPPLADFSFTSIPCASSVNVVSTASANGGAPLSGYLWNWGDGTPTSTLNPDSHAYTSSGPQQIKFVVTNSSGCKDSITKSFNVTVPPIIDFTVNPACLGLNANFTNISTTGGAASITYTWNFGGGGGTSNAVSPSLSFPSPGVFTVSLTGTNSDGCSNTIQKTFTVFPKPTVVFSANPVCVGSTSSFTNNSSIASGIITNWYWDFNNDAVTDNTTQNPTNIFASSGSFPVELKAQSDNGCMDSAVVNIIVNPNPTISFNATPACKRSTIILANNSSATAPASMTSYTWNFGSGSSIGTSNATAPANLTYTVAGVQTITLSGTSSDGCISSFTNTVNVFTSPTASFTANSVCSGSTTTFADISTPLSPSTGSVTIWAWDFDNNGTTDNSTQNPTNSFGSAGTYTVALIVTSANGCKDTVRKPVTIFGRAVPDFTPTGVCFGSSSTFTNLTSVNVTPNTGSASSYTWNFGNGATSNATNPVYMYTTPSNSTTNTTYSATLYVTTSNGCKDSITKPVTVYALPTPDFKSDSVCFGSTTTLQDISNSNGNPLLFFGWDWNNDGVADVINGNITSQNTFTAWGNISVTHTVYTSPNGGLLNCSSSITKNIWVHPSPVAGLTATNQCVNTQPVQISGMPSTIPTGSISNYAWDYGDGNINNSNISATTTHTFVNPGIYVITLTVSSGNGCTSAASQSVEVYDKPYGSFVYSKTCFGKTTTLTAMTASVGGTISNYDWDYNNTPLSAEASGQQVVTTFAAAGQQTLNLLLTSNKGCKNVIPGNVYINYNPKPNLFAPKRMGCTDLCIDIMDSTAALPGPAQNVSWEWDFGNNQILTQASGVTNKICYSNNSVYNLKKYDVSLVVRTDSGCVDSVRRKNYVVVYPKPIADFVWAGEDGDLLTPVITFTNTSQGYSNFMWYWNDALNALDSVHNYPKHYYNVEEPKTINVYMAVRNVYGCKDTVMKPIEIGGNFTFYIPNCFTPNDDGLNDTFTGTGIGIKEYKMWIFDRWGEMLYYTNDIKKGWDGSVKGHVVDGKIDVYQWKVTVTDIMGKVHHYIGHVTQLK